MRDSLPSESPVAARWVRPLWLLAGGASLLLGLLGLVLPVLPGVPFLLLAGFCFSRGSPRLEAWLLGHPVLGPHVRDWRRYRVIPRAAKRLAWTMMAFSCGLAAWRAPWWAALLASSICLCVALWMWRQPEERPQA